MEEIEFKEKQKKYGTMIVPINKTKGRKGVYQERIQFLMGIMSAAIPYPTGENSIELDYLIDKEHRETLQLWLMDNMKKYLNVKSLKDD